MRRPTLAMPGQPCLAAAASVLLLCCTFAGSLRAASSAPTVTGMVLEVEGLERAGDFAVRGAAVDHCVVWQPGTRVGRWMESWSDLRPEQREILRPDFATPDWDDRISIPLERDLLLVAPLAPSAWAQARAAGVLRLEGAFSLSLTERPHAPSRGEPTLVALLGRDERGRLTARVDGDRVQLDPGRWPKRFDQPTPLFGLADRGSVRPVVTEVAVWGHEASGPCLRAEVVAVRGLPDPLVGEDPALPRLLVVGDSISGNYDAAVRRALDGKVNVYHPPENAGNLGRGRERIRTWLGAWEQPGRGWDVVAFNFGHWNETGDSETTRDLLEFTYKVGLIEVLDAIEPTGARIIWMTSAPIPLGFGRGDSGRRSGKNALLNAWAAAVMEERPAVSIVDHHALVEHDARYREWWQGRDVHFPPTLAEPLGRALAAEVLRVLGRGDESLAPPAFAP